MHWLLSSIFLWPVFLLGQQRVSIDLNSNMQNLNYSVMFCPVLTNGFYLKTGISGGGIRWGEVYPSGSADEDVFRSAHDEMNFPEDSMINLNGYVTKIKAAGVELGIGKMWLVNPVHTFRIDFQGKFYHINERITAVYFPEDATKKGFYRQYKIPSWSFALGPEIFHSIRISTRLTTFYGVKFPWFIPLGTRNYDPSLNSPVKGFHWFLSLGLSCAVGKKSL